MRVARTCKRLGIRTVARVLGGGRQLAARGRVRRGASDRPAGRTGELSARGPHPGGRQAHGRPGDSSGLRFSVGERGLRRGMPAGGHRLHRSAGECDPRHGLQERGQAADGESRRAAGARLSRRGAGPRHALTRGGPHRLSGADQGLGRRRGQGHAHRRIRRAAQGRAGLRQARGSLVLRRRPRADREVPHAPAPHRDAGVCRHARQHHSSVRARLLGAAPASEGAGGSARARHDRRQTPADGLGGGGRRACGGIRQRRDGGVHRRREAASSTSWR